MSLTASSPVFAWGRTGPEYIDRRLTASDGMPPLSYTARASDESMVRSMPLTWVRTPPISPKGVNGVRSALWRKASKYGPKPPP